MRVHLLRLCVFGLAAAALACGGKSDSSKSKSKGKPDASSTAPPKEEAVKLDLFWDDPSYVLIGDQAPCPEGFWALFGGDPPGQRGGGADGYLLAQDGADGELEGIPGAGHPDARMRAPGGGEPGVPAEMAADDGGVGIEIEEVSHARDDGLGRDRRAAGHAQLEPRAARLVADLDDPATAAGRDRAAIAVRLDLLDARCRPGGEKADQRGPVVRRLEAQQLDRVAVGHQPDSIASACGRGSDPDAGPNRAETPPGRDAS